MVYNVLIVVSIVTPKPKQGQSGISADRIKLLSIRKLSLAKGHHKGHSLRICSSVSSSLLQKERNGVFFMRKTNNFVFKNKMLVRILYWNERKYVLTVVI